MTSNAVFRTFGVDARYEIALGDHLAVTPRFSVLRQTPWQVTDPAAVLYYTKTTTRTTPGLTLSYDPWPQLNVLVGGEAYFDRAHVDPHLETDNVMRSPTSRSAGATSTRARSAARWCRASR